MQQNFYIEASLDLTCSEVGMKQERIRQKERENAKN